MGFDALLGVCDGAVRDVLGGPVIYTPGSGSPVTVTGIFDALYIRVDVGSPAGISSRGPAVALRAADLPSDPEVDSAARVTISGLTYSFHETQPDGKGWVVLLLHLV